MIALLALRLSPIRWRLKSRALSVRPPMPKPNETTGDSLCSLCIHHLAPSIHRVSLGQTVVDHQMLDHARQTPKKIHHFSLPRSNSGATLPLAVGANTMLRAPLLLLLPPLLALLLSLLRAPLLLLLLPPYPATSLHARCTAGLGSR